MRRDQGDPEFIVDQKHNGETLVAKISQVFGMSSEVVTGIIDVCFMHRSSDHRVVYPVKTALTGCLKGFQYISSVLEIQLAGA